MVNSSAVSYSIGIATLLFTVYAYFFMSVYVVLTGLLIASVCQIVS